MSTKEVIKHSGAIQVSSNQISLLQRKIWNVLLANAYDDLLNKDEYTIKIKDLAEILKFDSKDLELLKDSIRVLCGVQVEWNILNKDDEEWTITHFLGDVTIKKRSGTLTYTWGKKLREKLYNPTMYAKISLAIQSRFKSKYSLTLYEVCVDYFIKKQGKGETPWITIEDFKKLIGAENDKYCKKFKHLNDFIIKKAVNEVNRESDIFIEVAKRTEGRKVVALKFYISPTPHANNLLTRLTKTPKQSVLSFEPYDEVKKGLYERMTQYFLLSEVQAKEILNTMYDLDEVKDILDMMERKIKRDEIKSNLGGYTYKALKEDYRPKKSLFAIEKEQEATAKQEEEKRKTKEKEIIEGLFEEYSKYRDKAVKEYLSQLLPANLTEIEKEFARGLNGFIHGKFKENGLKSAIVNQEYMQFIYKRFLESKILSFPSFTQEKGYILEKDGEEGWKMVNIKEMFGENKL